VAVSRTVTWTEDTTPPTITSVPLGGEVGCDAALPDDASVKAQATATDSCGAVSVVVSHVDSTTACSQSRTFTITAADSCNNSTTRTVVYTRNCAPCVPSTFSFNGSSALSGTAGNVRTFTTNGVSVKVTAFSRNKTSGSWATAYLGAYSGGLGVTDGSEGTGANSSHTVDNLGQDNYVLFEFSQPVVLSRAFLGYVVSDSDLNLWIGTFADPFNNHLTLSDSVLGSFGYTEENLTALTTTRWADLNAGQVMGNAVVIAAWLSDTTAEDQFKISLLNICKRECQPLSLACVSAVTGQASVAYSSALVASGGTAPYTYSILTGSLPPGLTLNPNSGVISGIPTAVGSFNFTAKVTDALGATATSGTGGCSIAIASPCVGSICGSVLRDCDADGILTGESGLAGWTVKLKNSSGTVVGSAITDVNGGYCFNSRAAGTYTVVVTPAANYTLTAPAGCNHQQTVNLTSCQNLTGVNFGYTGTAASVNLVMTGPASANCGDTITYTFYVTNTGNTCVYGGLRVDDPLLGGQVFHQTPVAPGQGFVFTKTYVVKSSDPNPLVNTATAIGDPPGSLANVTKTASVSTAVACNQGGCTLTIGYYKNHPSSITPLPSYLGTSGGTKTLVVSSQAIGVDVLGQRVYGAPANGITKLYAQLLAAKLNGLHGASLSAVSATISSADAFLATHDYLDWSSLSTTEKNSVLVWHSALDNYNNGVTGPGHCGDTECARALTVNATPGATQVALSWQASREATSYKVCRSLTPNGPYTALASLTGTSYTDKSLVNGTPYYYVVSAMKSGVVETDSDEVSAIPVAALPSPWQTRDIGGVVAVGGANCTSGKFTTTGSGKDIWGTADAFRYVYQSASGDCAIVAKVSGVQNTDPWAKAGVMIRETLNADSRHASVFVTPANGVAFQYRNASAGTSGNVNTTGLAAPYWVKVVRSGSTFTAYRSSTGTTWTTIGSQTITMGSSIYIGLGVTSHQEGLLCTATIESVTATP